MKISKNKIVNQIHKKLLKDRTKILEVRQRLVDKNYFTYQPKVVEFCSDGSQIVDSPYAEELTIFIKCRGKQ